MCKRISTRYRCYWCTAMSYKDDDLCTASWFKRIGRPMGMCEGTEYTIMEGPPTHVCAACVRVGREEPYIILNQDPVAPESRGSAFCGSALDTGETASIFGPLSTYTDYTAGKVGKLERWLDRHPERKGSEKVQDVDWMTAMSGLHINAEARSGTTMSDSTLSVGPEGMEPVYTTHLTQTPEEMDITDYDFGNQDFRVGPAWAWRGQIHKEPDWDAIEKDWAPFQEEYAKKVIEGNRKWELEKKKKLELEEKKELKLKEEKKWELEEKKEGE